MVPIKFPYHQRLKEFVGGDFSKGLPGIPGKKWDGKNKCWMVPFETLPSVEREAKRFGIQVQVPAAALSTQYCPEEIENSALYPFQKKAALEAFWRERHILSFEMGLGKTPTAIAALRAAQCERILIVTPAIVRLHWLAELNKWWPEHPEIGVISAGKSRKVLSKKERGRLDAAYAAPIQIVSYALLDEVAEGPWSAVVVDEAHRVKTPGAVQSKAIRRIVVANPDCRVLALTGTLVPNEPKDIWNVCDLLWPGRFGASKYEDRIAWAFLARYATQRDNGYGTVWQGLNQEYAQELQERLTRLSSRVTKAEVAHLLPPYTVTLLTIDTGVKSPQSFAEWKASLDGSADPGLTEKIPAIHEWVEDASEGATHLCVMTHLKDSARYLANYFRAHAAQVFYITGDQTPEQRNALLAEAARAPGAIVVATMHSVGIGIDLTFCTQALFAELYYSPEKVLQAVGRFSRLSGKVPSSVQFLVRQSTMDEKIANILLAKIENANKIVKAGDGEEKVLAALGGSANEDELLAELSAALEVA